jgi:predicted amidohydrolase YtcJ
VDLVFREVEVGGRGPLDVAVYGGRIARVGLRLDVRGAVEIDGGGGALIPGLWDHHIHLFGLAASLDSVDVSPAAVRDADGLRRAFLAASPGSWIRAVGYDDAVAGPLDRARLDALAPERPLRVQYRTGSLWALNSEGVRRLGRGPFPPGVELTDGEPTGRIFREDRWLRERIGAAPPSLARVGRMLAGFGVTGVTDATVTTDAASAQALAQAVRQGDLPQRLRLMSGADLPADGAYAVGAWKIVLDDASLPDPAEPAAAMRRAHAAGRAVAVHCVTAAELAVALAAFAEAGTVDGDRIEHGGVVDPAGRKAIAELGLTVVTQPVFVADRGDRYRAEVEPGDQPFLYPAASLIEAGVKVAGSSDAPYGSPDPWRGLRAAVTRETAGGAVLTAAERLTPERALQLWLGAPDDPGGPPRRVQEGSEADLCLLHTPLAEALDAPSAELVRATFVGGVRAA